MNLGGRQWTFAEDLVAVLKPFEVATTMLSVENVSLSCILPIMKGLLSTISSKDDDFLVIDNFKAILREQLTSCFSLDILDTAGLLSLAPSLDPRFKHLSFLTPEDIQAARSAL